jgi:flavin-dependent dehydrogenase
MIASAPEHDPSGTRLYDVIIAGAGPAGAASAAVLARAGLDVIVLEAARFPRFSVGESLLPQSLTMLEEAGLLDAVRARGYQHKPGGCFLRGNERFEFQFSEQWTSGFDHALQVPRDDFDVTLAAAAAAYGAQVRTETRVTSVRRDESGVVHVGTRKVAGKISDASEPQILRSRFFIDSSGSARALAGLQGWNEPSSQAERVSIATWFRDETGDVAGPAGLTWVSIVRPDTWMWVIPFADGVASVGVVGDARFLDDLGDDPSKVLRGLIAADPWLQPRFAGLAAVSPTRSFRGYSSESAQYWAPGLCLTGNALGFLDPIFSSGVTLALTSGVRAAQLVVAQLAGEEVDWAKSYEAPMRAGLDVFRNYVDAWYDGTLPQLFFRPGKSENVRRQLCSMLAGYVWDDSNAMVKSPRRKLAQIRRTLLTAGA